MIVFGYSIMVNQSIQLVYHLAHLVDDTLIHTNLVIRDESWLPSVPLHNQLFDFAGLNKPKYLHTAQILTLDEKTGNARKVSKRYDPWADSREFIKHGIPSEAIREYLMMLLNSNFETFRLNNPDSNMKEYKFNISNMNKSGAQFDHEKLNFISKNVISKFTAEKVYDEVLKFAEENDKELYDLLNSNKDYCIKMFNIERNTIKPRKDISKYSDVKGLYYYFFNELFNKKEMKEDK